MQKFISKLIIIILAVTGCSKQPVPEGDGKVIILMYHSITVGEPANLYERSAADFESDLVYLKNNNIKVIGFDELEHIVNKGIAPHENMAIITFDDGYHTWLTNVKPLLLKYDMKATFFLWVSQIGMNTFLSWEEVDLMSHYYTRDGHRPFTFASHTMSHHFLHEMKSIFNDSAEYIAYLDEELGNSKTIIETFTPVPVKVLSLPYGNGAGDADIIAAAKRNGYSCIRTSIWNAVSPREADLYNLPSLPMLDTSNPEIIGTYLGL